MLQGSNIYVYLFYKEKTWFPLNRLLTYICYAFSFDLDKIFMRNDYDLIEKHARMIAETKTDTQTETERE